MKAVCFSSLLFSFLIGMKLTKTSLKGVSYGIVWHVWSVAYGNTADSSVGRMTCVTCQRARRAAPLLAAACFLNGKLNLDTNVSWFARTAIQNSTDWVTSTTEIYILTFLEIGSPDQDGTRVGFSSGFSWFAEIDVFFLEPV